MIIERQNPLAITDVKDSQNNSVPNGGTTDSKELTLFGGATASTVVTILDNSSPLGTASVTLSGTWEKSVAGLSTGAHSFTVRATDGTPSSPWLVNIDTSLQLPAPTVIGVDNGELNPIDAVSGARVVVTYSGMATTDIIGLSWDGHDNVVPTQPGSGMGSVIFTVPASAVAAVLGRAIGVLYAVVRNGNAKPSELLTLRVLPLPESALTAPKIRQAPDDQNLDVTALTGDADLFEPVWPLIATGQRISLRFEGTKADGSAYNWAHDTWQNLPISSPTEPNTKIKLSDLQQLKDGSALRLIFEVSFDGGTTKVAFPVRGLTVAVEKLSSGYQDFNLEPGGVRVYPPNTPHQFYSGLVMTTTAGATPATLHIMWLNSSLSPGNGIVAQFDLGGAANRIEFGYTTAVGGAWPNLVKFYGSSNLLIGQMSFEGSFATAKKLIFESPLKCSYFTINANLTGNYELAVSIFNIRWSNH